jgi:hypothetical protein
MLLLRTLGGGAVSELTSRHQRAALKGAARGRAVGSSDEPVPKATLQLEEVEDRSASVMNLRCGVRWARTEAPPLGQNLTRAAQA